MLKRMLIQNTENDIQRHPFFLMVKLSDVLVSITRWNDGKTLSTWMKLKIWMQLNYKEVICILLTNPNSRLVVVLMNWSVSGHVFLMMAQKVVLLCIWLITHWDKTCFCVVLFLEWSVFFSYLFYICPRSHFSPFRIIVSLLLTFIFTGV